jgi:uncharacterized membrane protein YkvA (DUF1232 family)
VSLTSLPRFLFTGRSLQVIRHLPDFARLYWRLFRDQRVSMLPKALLVLTLAYFVWPVDVIPDFIPVLGELDDMGIVLLGLWTFVRLCPPEVVRQRVDEIASKRSPARA